MAAGPAAFLHAVRTRRSQVSWRKSPLVDDNDWARRPPEQGIPSRTKKPSRDRPTTAGTNDDQLCVDRQPQQGAGRIAIPYRAQPDLDPGVLLAPTGHAIVKRAPPLTRFELSEIRPGGRHLVMPGMGHHQRHLAGCGSLQGESHGLFTFRRSVDTDHNRGISWSEFQNGLRGVGVGR